MKSEMKYKVINNLYLQKRKKEPDSDFRHIKI